MMALNEWSWGLLWLLATALVFGLPLLPGWLELKQRRDARPLAIDGDDDGETDYRVKVLAPRLPALASLPQAAGWLQGGRYEVPEGTQLDAVRVHEPLRLGRGARAEILISDGRLVLAADSQVVHLAHADTIVCEGPARLTGRASAERLIVLASGSRGFRLAAPCLVTAPLAAPPTDLPAAQDTPLPGMPQRRPDGLVLEPGERLEGPVVVTGRLHLKAGATLAGHVKVHGDAELARGACIEGALFATGSIRCQGDNRLQGPISAVRRVTLGAGCRAGSPAIPCSVSGWDVHLGPDVAVFGTITSVRGCDVAAA
ncbi:MAG TPA: hypothetical protein PKA16_12330 [Ottowia sp.]|uniref:hypothetical protein n=1 Tax=Ottowia sp. TaxID=1898956 RepID=UPI002CB39E53|nr:hypothetical protein [Ottowia sp.]HMN22165.1 hypothetical protein [Ottowia sp.]